MRVSLCFIFGNEGRQIENERERERVRERESEGLSQNSLILAANQEFSPGPWLLIPPQGKKKKKALKAQNEEPAQSEESDAEEEVEAEKPKENP